MIAVDRVSYQVNRLALLNNVTLAIPENNITVIMGPNGAGKSTLVKTLSGELEDIQGTIKLADKYLGEWSARELACRRAVVTQFNHIAFPFTVMEIIKMGLLPQAPGKHELEDYYQSIEDVMLELDILGLKDRMYSTLSGGEQQRVSIARALVQLLSISSQSLMSYLLLDEPTASLDLNHQHQLLKILKNKVKENYCVLMILHDINLALQYADNIVLMKDGTIFDNGPADEVLTELNIHQVFSIQGKIFKLDDQSHRFHVYS